MRDMHPTLPPDGKIEKVTDVTKAKLETLNAELYDTQFATYETAFHARSIGTKDASVPLEAGETMGVNPNEKAD
jgi:hypothetical protein